MRQQIRQSIVTVIVTLLGITLPSAQVATPQAAFTAALGRVSTSLEGRFADDGERVSAAIDAMDRALAAWDTAIQQNQAASTADVQWAQPATAVRLRVALALTLAERGRTADAVSQLQEALTLAPNDVDVHTVLGLVHGQLTGAAAAAASAFRTAVAAAPSAPLQRYLLVKQLVDNGALEDAAAAGRELRQDVRSADAPDRAPFLRLHLLPEVEAIEPYFPTARYAPPFTALAKADYQLAVTALRAAFKEDAFATPPNAIKGWLAEAGTAFRDGDTAAALVALDKARQAAPVWSDAQRLRGIVLAATDQIDLALAAFADVLRQSPADERTHLALADVLVQQERWADAEVALSAAIVAVPGSPRLYHARGRTRQRLGRYPEALADFDRALAVEPALPLLGKNSLLETIATLQRAQQAFPAAAAAFAARVNLIPNSVAAHRDLGDIYARQGLDDLAWTEFAIAEALAPRDVGTQAALAQLHLRAGRHAEAIAAARRAVALDATHIQAHYVLGTALVRTDRTEEGTRELDVFQRLQSAEAEKRRLDLELSAWRREAALAADQGNHGSAVTLWSRIVEQAPRLASAYVELGAALIRAGRAADAVDRLQQAAGLGATGDVYRHLGAAYDALGQTAEALQAREAYAKLRRDELRQAGRQ